jgi:hypothetical protein
MSSTPTTNSTIPLTNAEIAIIGVSSGGVLIIAITLCVWWQFKRSKQKTETTQPSEKQSLIPTNPPPPNPPAYIPQPPNPPAYIPQPPNPPAYIPQPPNPPAYIPQPPNPPPPTPQPVGTPHGILKVDRFMRHNA